MQQARVPFDIPSRLGYNSDMKLAIFKTVILLLAPVMQLLLSPARLPDEAAAQTAARSSATLVVGLLSDPGTLNPLYASSTQAKDIIERMFLKLMDEESDFVRFRPRLAERWSFSSDGLELTVHLRRDVTWHDGAPCTASDVVFTWECQIDTLVSWSGRHIKDRIAAVEVIDDYTVRFRYSNRYPYQLMDANDGVILPRHLLERIPREELRTCDFSRHPVGNGPYRLARWESKQYLILEKNPDYYDGETVAIERIVFRIVPDMITLISQLKAGEIDCLESIPPDDALSIERGYDRLRLYTYPSRSMTFISWNCTKEPFTDDEIRRALGMAIDRRAIIETVWRGMAEVCGSPMHPVLWACDDAIEALPFDPAASRNMLEACGWIDQDGDGVLERDGKKFSFEMIANYGNQQRIDIMTMVQAQLKEIGVNVELRVLEWNAFIERITGFGYDSCVMGWKVGTRADLMEFWHSSSIGSGGMNISGFRDPEVDTQISEARNALDREAAQKLWSACQRKIYRAQPFCFIAVPYEIYALDRRFAHVEPSPITFFYNLEKWTITGDRR